MVELFAVQVLNKENMSWPHNFVQSYVTHKTGKDHVTRLTASPWSPHAVLTERLCAVRQEEKRRLLRRNNELKNECAHLEEQDKQLGDTLKVSEARRREARPDGKSTRHCEELNVASSCVCRNAWI